MSSPGRVPYKERTDVDAELWVVNAPDWSLPVIVTRVIHNDAEYLRARRACTFEIEQVLALDEFLGSRAVGRGQTGWIIAPDLFTEISTKAPGITPGRYIRWGSSSTVDPNPDLRSSQRSSGDKLVSEFISDIASKLGSKPEDLTLVWHVICQAIPEWLISGRSVDFGSIKLSAVPYRRNWKRVLFSRSPGLRSIYRSKDRRRLLRAMLDREHRIFTMTDMAGTRRRSGHFVTDWTVEVQHTKNWRDLCVEREYQISKRDPAKYVQRWAATVEASMERIHEIAAEEADEDRTPAPRAEWDRRARGHRFVLGPPTVLVDPLPQCSHPDGPQSVDDIQVAEGKREEMETTLASLLALPAVQPGAPDVRDAGPVDDAGGDLRVLVPDTGCGEAGGQGLLEAGDGAGDGMAGRTETGVPKSCPTPS